MDRQGTTAGQGGPRSRNPGFGSASPRTPSPEDTAPNNRTPVHELYANRIFSYSSGHSNATLYPGEHYHALAQFLVTSANLPGPEAASADVEDENKPSFVVIHTFRSSSSGGGSGESRAIRRRVNHIKSFTEFSQRWNGLNGNRVLLLRGYPSADWLCRLGGKLNLDYEFLYQHFSNDSQLGIAENHTLPPFSLLSSGTIQLTFTSIGSWDNHCSGIDLTTARKELYREMKAFVDANNRGQGPEICDSIVRSFHIHDLRHFTIDQMVSIKLVEHGGCWTCKVLIWTDCATSLSRSHGGPWLQIEQRHSSATRFLPLAIHHSNTNIRRLAASLTRRHSSGNDGGNGVGVGVGESSPATGLVQTLSFLHDDLGKSLDQQVASEDPFYSIDEIFRLYASSEHQFLNLMEEKVHERGLDRNDIRGCMAEIQTIKKLVDKHAERLRDALETVNNRGGGGGWPRGKGGDDDASEPSPVSQRRGTSDEAASSLGLTFRKLVRRAEAVSATCAGEMTTLSHDAMAEETHRTIKQAEGVAKVTFIAFIFVPLSFTTSFFGMNIMELNDNGPGLWTWLAVSIPVMMASMFAWWLDAEKRRAAWRVISHRAVRVVKG